MGIMLGKQECLATVTSPLKTTCLWACPALPQ